jgi:MscS family membrane protein
MKCRITAPIYKHGTTGAGVANVVSLALALLMIFATEPRAQQVSSQPEKVQVEASLEFQGTVESIRTESPRRTFSTFQRLREEFERSILAYREEESWALAGHRDVLMDQFIALIDMSQVPRTSRRQVGYATTAYLLDILGRVELPETADIPDLDSFQDKTSGQSWRIPGTPIRITKMDEGAREGEFLFSSRTIVSAPRFYRGIQYLPLRSRLDIKSWSKLLPQMTGPLLPSEVSTAMPDTLLELWFDTPIWKILLTLLLFILAFSIIAWLNGKTQKNGVEATLRSTLVALLPPVATILIVTLIEPLVSRGIIVIGRFATFTDIVFVSTGYFSFAWISWVAILAFFEWINSSPKISEDSLDANLLRFTARIIGIIAVVLVLAFGAHELGLPVLSLLAGLGIGGLAVALAIRPTLENLIGGFILYIDKPVRVGDFCTFGDYTGTVEKIGIRSTEIRSRDRTLISIPNAKFADMEIVNWAQCDQMLINAVIGLRYETTSDQLRYVLAKMRKMFHAHPRINNETIRVRFSGYGTSSLDVTIRVYAVTREWNDFHAIREDVLMRVNDIVTESGTGFAFPSQTLYMGQDNGLDKERSETAKEEVKSWRRQGKLPFPRLSAEQIEEITDTLDYPPKGSVEFGADTTPDYEPEKLSSESLANEELTSEIEPKKEDIHEKSHRSDR